MKRMLSLVLALLMLAGLTVGCGSRPEEEPEGLKLWFTTDLSQWSAEVSALTTCPYEGEETAAAMMDALLSGPPGNGALVSPIPAGTSLVSWSLNDGVLRIALSRHYSELMGAALTLADYCIALTLCQLPEVEGVQIVVSGGTPAWRNRDRAAQRRTRSSASLPERPRLMPRRSLSPEADASRPGRCRYRCSRHSFRPSRSSASRRARTARSSGRGG